MFKKWRSCLSLLVCLSCILSMLFLDILEVRAYSSPIGGYIAQAQSFSKSGNLYYEVNYDSASAGTISGYIPPGQSTQSGSISGTIRTVPMGVNGSAHCVVPIELRAQTLVNDIDNTKYYCIGLSPIFSATCTLEHGYIESWHVDNWCIKDYEGNLIYTSDSNLSTTSCFYRGTQINVLNQNQAKAQFKCYLEFDASFGGLQSTGSATDFGVLGKVNYSLSGTWDIFSLTSTAQEGLKEQTNDVITQQKLTDLNNKQQQANNIAQDTNTNMKSFFASFFDNLLHIFVPEDGFFEDWFSDLNDLLASKLGFLYAPFDVFFSLMNALLSADTAEAVIPFPEISWDGTTIVEATNLKLSDILGNNFDSVRTALYFLTDLICILAVFSLMRKKLNLILRGDDNDS